MEALVCTALHQPRFGSVIVGMVRIGEGRVDPGPQQSETDRTFLCPNSEAVMTDLTMLKLEERANMQCNPSLWWGGLEVF
jgi:hypothetical protein